MHQTCTRHLRHPLGYSRYPGAGIVVDDELALAEELEKLAEDVEEAIEDENDCTASSCAVSGSGGVK